MHLSSTEQFSGEGSAGAFIKKGSGRRGGSLQSWLGPQDSIYAVAEVFQNPRPTSWRSHQSF